MTSAIGRFLTVLIGVGTVAATSFFLEQTWQASKDMSFVISDESPTETVTKGAEGEGEGAIRVPASTNSTGSTLSLEQTLSNVLDAQSNSHSLVLKLDLELFEDANRDLVDQRQSVVKSIIIETSREQSYEQLSTLAGKAYFKQLLVSRMNEAFHKAVVREVHFNAFYIQ